MPATDWWLPPETWEAMSEKQRKEHHLQVRAYFFSQHRALEEREAPPEHDWLNAVWVHSNDHLFHLIQREAEDAIRKALELTSYAAVPDHTVLSKEATGRSLVLETLRMAAEKRNTKLNIKDPALSQSKTFAGLMEAVVTQLRLQQSAQKTKDS